MIKVFCFSRPLAQTLRRLAQHGAQDFYHGKLARDIVADLQAGGNTMTLNDLSSYRAEIGEPLSLQYRDITLHTAGNNDWWPGIDDGNGYSCTIKLLQEGIWVLKRC